MLDSHNLQDVPASPTGWKVLPSSERRSRAPDPRETDDRQLT